MKQLQKALAAVLALVCVWWCTGCNPANNFGAEFVSALPIDTTSRVPLSYSIIDTVRLGTSLNGGDFIDNPNDNRIFSNLFGTYHDPYLGTIKAATFFEFTSGFERLVSYTFNNKALGYQPTADSFFIYLTVSSRYGNLTEPQTLRLSQLTDTLDVDKVYGTTDSVATGAADISGSFTLTFNPNSASRTIKLPLPLAWAQAILDSGGPYIQDTGRTRLRNFFKGFYVTSTTQMGSTTGCVYSLETLGASFFNLSTFNTRLELKYRSKDSTAQTTFTSRSPIRFIMAPENPRFHSVRRSSTAGKLIETILNPLNTNPTHGLVQGGAQLLTKIQLPNLQTALPDAAYNEAYLTVFLDTTLLAGTPDLLPPPSLDLVPMLANGTTPDGTLDGFSFRNLIPEALYNQQTKSYRFSIQTYLQLVRGGQVPNNGLALLVPNRHSRVHRAIVALGGHPNPALRPRVQVFFTSVP